MPFWIYDSISQNHRKSQKWCSDGNINTFDTWGARHLLAGHDDATTIMVQNGFQTSDTVHERVKKSPTNELPAAVWGD